MKTTNTKLRILLSNCLLLAGLTAGTSAVAQGTAKQPQDPVRVGNYFEVNIGSVGAPPDPIRFFRLAQP